MKFKIITDNKDKVFTYNTNEYQVLDNFVKFVDNKNVTRLIPISRVIEVVQNE